MNREEYRSALWKKEAKSGVKYCSGKLKIGEREYQVTLFNNDKKGNEKAPDFNLIIKDSINTQGKQEQVKEVPKNSELEQVKDPLKDEKTFEQFYIDELDYTEDDFPF